MQRTLAEYNAEREPSEQVLLCIGVGHGDMLRISDDDVFGAEVNAASKLGEDTAGPGEILVTANVLDVAMAVEGVTGSRRLPEAPPGAGAAYSLEYR